MTRVIKFKIWNKHGKKMFEPYKYKDGRLLLRMWDGKIVDVFESDKREVLGEQEQEHLIPLQYTGLKDKKGKEIYEGDIVIKTTPDNDDFGEDSISEPVEVIWIMHKWMFTDKKYRPMGKGHWTHYASLSSCVELGSYFEIIGNIYENPELLN